MGPSSVRGARSHKAVVNEQLPLRLEGGLLCTEIDGKRIVIDTGTPASVGNAPLRLGHRDFPLMSQFVGVSIEALSDHVEAGVDVLLGNDVLGEFEMIIDLATNSLELRARTATAPAGATPLSSYMGVPVVETRLGHDVLRLYLDTGAALTYLAPRRTQGLPAGARFEDFYPGWGMFHTDTFSVTLDLKADDTTHRLATRVGHLPPALSTLVGPGGVEGILGNDILQQLRMTLSLSGGWLLLERR